jgi:hypothetical protein
VTRLYGVLTQACGSLAVALLAVALMTAGARDAFADVPPPPPPPPVVDCPNDCACFTITSPCYYGQCTVTVQGCATSCGCTGPDTGGNDCSCVN